MSRKLTLSILALALFVIGAQAAVAKESYVYSVKFVCGYNDTNVGLTSGPLPVPAGEPPVKFGNYATEINIVWPEIYAGETSVFIGKHLITLVENGRPVGREPNVRPAAQYADSIFLPGMSGTMDDCNRIAELLYGSIPSPYPLTIGYLVLTTTHEIDVTAVYTSQACSNWSKSPVKLECLDKDGALTGVSNSIDVEKIEGRKLQQTF